MSEPVTGPTAHEDRPLAGRVAVVAGASRGAGRGIALELGAAGATVYAVGRTRRETPRSDGIPGTVDDTADEIDADGGEGIAVHADLTRAEDVRAVFERVEAEQSRLDILANAVWGGADAYPSTDEWMAAWGRPFWEQPPLWDAMMGAGPRAYFLASAHAARMMAERGRGLIVGVTDFVSDDAAAEGRAVDYSGQLLPDVAHRTIDRLMYGMGQEGRPHGISVIALMPGFMRTEVVESFMNTEERRRQFGYDRTETPRYLGRAVAALAADPRVMEKVGRVQFVADLAEEYGFTDIDGSVHPRFDPHAQEETQENGGSS